MKFIYILFFLIFIISCDKESISEYVYIPTSNTDENYIPWGNNTILKGDTLIIYNSQYSFLELLDLRSKTVIKSSRIKSSPIYVNYFSNNQLILLHRFQNYVELYDLNTMEIITRINHNFKSIDGEALNFQNFILKSNDLYYFQYSIFETKNYFCYPRVVALKFNDTKDSLLTVNGRIVEYPKKYCNDKNYASWYTNSIPQDNSLIVAFSISKDLYKYDLSTKKVDEYEFPDYGFKGSMEFDTKTKDGRLSLPMYQLMKPDYQHLIPTNKDYFYRVIKLAAPDSAKTLYDLDNATYDYVIQKISNELVLLKDTIVSTNFRILYSETPFYYNDFIYFYLSLHNILRQEDKYSFYKMRF